MNQYTWSHNEKDELWQHDNFDTEDECILDAKENYDMKSGDKIAIGIVYPYVLSIDIESILEQIEGDAYKECGESAENWGIASRKDYGKEIDELKEKVTELVNAYIENIGEKPTFYKIDNIYTVTLNKSMKSKYPVNIVFDGDVEQVIRDRAKELGLGIAPYIKSCVIRDLNNK